MLFAFDQAEQIVGRVSIRHELKGELLHIGGHVGYGVVPSRRKAGYATEILRASLGFICAELPLKEVLLTCDETNIGSIKTIERNGGVFENHYHTASMKVRKRRYWIKTDDQVSS